RAYSRCSPTPNRASRGPRDAPFRGGWALSARRPSDLEETDQAARAFHHVLLDRAGHQVAVPGPESFDDGLVRVRDVLQVRVEQEVGSVGADDGSSLGLQVVEEPDEPAVPGGGAEAIVKVQVQLRERLQASTPALQPHALDD